jgi:hypothetical protein
VGIEYEECDEMEADECDETVAEEDEWDEAEADEIDAEERDAHMSEVAKEAEEEGWEDFPAGPLAEPSKNCANFAGGEGATGGCDCWMGGCDCWTCGCDCWICGCDSLEKCKGDIWLRGEHVLAVFWDERSTTEVSGAAEADSKAKAAEAKAEDDGAVIEREDGPEGAETGDGERRVGGGAEAKGADSRVACSVWSGTDKVSEREMASCVSRPSGAL